MSKRPIARRSFLGRLAGISMAAGLGLPAGAAGAGAFKLRYVLASSMYGRLKLETILPEVKKTGAMGIDLWPAPHGDQREQADAMGLDAFEALLAKHGVGVRILTRYDLGPFGLQDEMRVAERLGARVIVSGARGPVGLTGAALKAAVAEFLEKLKPHVEAAAKHGVLIGIENHANSLIDSPDSIRWFAELASSEHVGVALAPYHLPQDSLVLADLIRSVDKRLVNFYAWQHGVGCHEKRPKEEELLQMPGRGELDFGPVLAALKAIGYAGPAQIFMHPVPRGIPILPSAAEVTAEVNRSRAYLEKCLAALG